MTRPTDSTRLRSRSLRAGVLAAALVALAACGSDDDDDAASASSTPTTATSSSTAATTDPSAGVDTPAATTLVVSSVDFGYELDSTELAAGEYTIELTNDGSARHDLVVERDGADVDGTDAIGAGESTSMTVDLEPGEYVFYCSIGNHRAMGMEVTITVT